MCLNWKKGVTFCTLGWDYSENMMTFLCTVSIFQQGPPMAYSSGIFFKAQKTETIGKNKGFLYVSCFSWCMFLKRHLCQNPVPLSTWCLTLWMDVAAINPRRLLNHWENSVDYNWKMLLWAVQGGKKAWGLEGLSFKICPTFSCLQDHDGVSFPESHSLLIGLRGPLILVLPSSQRGEDHMKLYIKCSSDCKILYLM